MHLFDYQFSGSAHVVKQIGVGGILGTSMLLLQLTADPKSPHTELSTVINACICENLIYKMYKTNNSLDTVQSKLYRHNLKTDNLK